MNTTATFSRQPWNKGKLVGQKAPLLLSDIWAIRVRLQIAERSRDLALFNLDARPLRSLRPYHHARVRWTSPMRLRPC